MRGSDPIPRAMVEGIAVVDPAIATIVRVSRVSASAVLAEV